MFPTSKINLSEKNWTSRIDLKKSNKHGLDKMERRVQNFKNLGKNVAAATIGDYLVNTDLWTTSSLSNRLFDNKTSMLNSSRCMDFPNGKCMYF